MMSVSTTIFSMHPFAIQPPIAGSLACPCDLSTFQTPIDRPSTSASTLGSRLRHGCRETDSLRLPRRSGWLISPHHFSSLHTTFGNQIIPQGRASRSLAKNVGAGSDARSYRDPINPPGRSVWKPRRSANSFRMPFGQQHRRDDSWDQMRLRNSWNINLAGPLAEIRG